MGCFKKQYPDSAKQVTSYREMQAWQLIILGCEICQALDLALAKHGNIAVANTSQSLHRMPITTESDSNLIVLTYWPKHA